MSGFARRFARNRPAVAGLIVLAAIVAIALAAPALYPQSPFALVGKPFQEATVLRAADAFEKATPFRDRRPALSSALVAAQ